jgi:hypothetical protein
VKEKQSSNPLKRFGTVLGRRRQSTHPYSQASSSDQKSSSNIGSAFSGFGKAKSKDREPPGSSDRPGSPLRPLPETARSPEPESPKNTRAPSTEPPYSAPHDIPLDASVSTIPNGTVHDSIPELIEPLAPPPTEEAKPEVCYSKQSHVTARTDMHSHRRMLRVSLYHHQHSMPLLKPSERLDCKQTLTYLSNVI